MVSPQGRREQCAYACGRGIPKRRACGLIGMARSTLSYELRQPVKDAPVIATMKLLHRSIHVTAIAGFGSSCAARA